MDAPCCASSACCDPSEKVWKALTELDELRGWHPSPFELEPVLGGVVRPKGDDEGVPPGWRELNRAYEERFGIPSDEAMPPLRVEDGRERWAPRPMSSGAPGGLLLECSLCGTEEDTRPF